MSIIHNSEVLIICKCIRTFKETCDAYQQLSEDMIKDHPLEVYHSALVWLPLESSIRAAFHRPREHWDIIGPWELVPKDKKSIEEFYYRQRNAGQTTTKFASSEDGRYFVSVYGQTVYLWCYRFEDGVVEMLFTTNDADWTQSVDSVLVSRNIRVGHCQVIVKNSNSKGLQVSFEAMDQVDSSSYEEIPFISWGVFANPTRSINHRYPRDGGQICHPECDIPLRHHFAGISWGRYVRYVRHPRLRDVLCLLYRRGEILLLRAPLNNLPISDQNLTTSSASGNRRLRYESDELFTCRLDLKK